MGGYEPNPVAWAVNGIPKPFQFQLLEPDFDHFAPTMELAIGRVPALADTGIRTLINGPESFTPDGNFILGEAPELPNFFVGAGFNAFGIAAGGGAGQALAQWVHDGSADRMATPIGCALARSRRTGSTTRWPGRSKSTTVVDRAGSRRCTRG
jgi:4-methylaminobutanoate oxidase (formaldehyde-forming)